MAEIKPRGADAAPPGYFSLWFSAIVPTNKLAHKRRLEEEDLPGCVGLRRARPSAGAAGPHSRTSTAPPRRQLPAACQPAR